MKLMEILNEVIRIEKDGILSEAKGKAKKNLKDKIRTKYNAKKDMALKITNKLKPRLNSITWTDDIKDVRNEVVSAFMANDADKVISMMTGTEGYKVVEILKALEVAHGGYKKLEAKAGDKKNFIKTVFAYIDENESTEDSEEETK